jgi:hypothetical protein
MTPAWALLALLATMPPPPLGHAARVPWPQPLPAQAVAQQLTAADAASLDVLGAAIAARAFTDLDKARAGYDWVVANVYIDDDASADVADMFITRRAPAWGVAPLLRAILTRAGVQSVVIHGLAQRRVEDPLVEHSWLAVHLSYPGGQGFALADPALRILDDEAVRVGFLLAPGRAPPYRHRVRRLCITRTVITGAQPLFVDVIDDGAPAERLFAPPAVFLRSHVPDDAGWALLAGAPAAARLRSQLFLEPVFFWKGLGWPGPSPIAQRGLQEFRIDNTSGATVTGDVCHQGLCKPCNGAPTATTSLSCNVVGPGTLRLFVADGPGKGVELVGLVPVNP